MIFLFWISKFCRRPDVDLQKKKVINTQTLTSNLGNKVVHFSNEFIAEHATLPIALR